MNDIALTSFCFILSVVLSYGFVGLIRHRLSAQLLDIPNHRSSHQIPTPRGGGLGFILAMACTSPLLAYGFPEQVPGQTLGQMAMVLAPLALVGYLDDRYQLSARIRYGVQLGVASLAVYNFGAFPLLELPQFGSVSHGFALGLTVFSLTALINFTNFMDGLDGLVAGISSIQFAFLGLYLHQPLAGLWVAVLIGFLGWNWAPAKIFMGDVGSTVLGAAIGIALLTIPGPPSAAIGFDPRWSSIAITLPILGDTVYTLVRRLLRRENIFQAHRLHLYQRLQQAGWSHRQVAVTYMGLTAAIAGLVFWGDLGGALASVALIAIAIPLGEIYLYRRLGRVIN